MPNLLVEIGVEELPSDALDVIYNHLKGMTTKSLEENRLSHGEILVEATPRRISLFIEDLPTRQEDQVIEHSGPSHEKSYDNDGKPTKALEGFLRSKGATADQVVFKENTRGKFATLEQYEKGQALNKVLGGLLDQLFTSLPFPKMMRWESEGFRFPRPVRWLVVLLDKRVLPMKWGGLKAANKSRGHRFLSPKQFTLTSANWELYKKTLKKNHVILDLEDRKSLVRKSLMTTYKQKKIDESLVHLTAQLVEEPYLIEGGFSKEYLDLPGEVLATCMKKHQKIFACYNAQGRLVNKFFAVMNGKRKGPARVRADFENVLLSRLKDAQFFYREDTKEKLETKVASLEQITYLGKLGNIYEKVERMEGLVDYFAQVAGKPELAGDLKQAVRLSKTDLMTQLVYEFPELQGTVGREYALQNGEKAEVADAIGTQYLPASLNESYEDVRSQFNELGALVGVLDRWDLLVGAIGTGIPTSSSQDPYALRRAGGSFVKIIRAFGLRFSLSEALEKQMQLYGDKLQLQKKELEDQLIKQFLRDRVAFELNVKPGTRENEIFQAVWKSSCDDLADVFERYQILIDLSNQETDGFMRAAKVVERTSNILKGIKGEVPLEIKPDLFQEPLEKELFSLLESKSSEINTNLQEREYAQATRLFGDFFYQPIHDFFQQIMVNAEDTAIRHNRQALMKRIHSLYADRLADLSLLSRIDLE